MTTNSVVLVLLFFNLLAVISGYAFSPPYTSYSSASSARRKHPLKRRVLPAGGCDMSLSTKRPERRRETSSSSSLGLQRSLDAVTASSTSMSTSMSPSSSDEESSDSSSDSTSRLASILVQPSYSSRRSKRRNRLKSGNNKRKNNNKKNSYKHKAGTTTHQNGYASSVNKDNVYLSTSGNLPDPWHGAISMEHLRKHAQFRPLDLPPPNQLSCLEDVRFFRQDSWQWNVLHQGRCTTSMAAAALGFLEPTTGQVLGIPPSWRRGAGKAFVRLRQPAVRTLEEINAMLLNPPNDIDGNNLNNNNNNNNNINAEKTPEDPVWQTPSTPSSTSSSSTNSNTTAESSLATNSAPNDQRVFVADYLHKPSSSEMQRRKAYMRERSSPEYLTKSIRLIWGCTQEATAMLTALNYFSKKTAACSSSNNVTLAEVGMCGAGLDLNQSTSSLSSSLLVGATPDGVLCYEDGRVEALEVKNHCPFFSNAGRKRRAGKVKGSFSIGDRPMDQTGILAQYVSQMQLEMLCLGPQCQSAVMVRQTATQGAFIIRMHRDDAWIDEMIYFLHLFQRDYVEKNIKPPTDFFWHGHGNNDAITKRYRRFVNRTAHLKGNIVAYIPHNEIQRVDGPSPFFLDHL